MPTQYADDSCSVAERHVRKWGGRPCRSNTNTRSLRKPTPVTGSRRPIVSSSSRPSTASAVSHTRLVLPRAVLLGLTLAYVLLGLYFVYTMKERARSVAADLLESRLSAVRH